MDTIYRNSALAEVVVDLQWQLNPLTIPPGAAVDPFLDDLRDTLDGRLEQLGIGRRVDLVPPQVPREMLAWKPIYRYEKSQDAWPKAQLGPGVFSVNMGGQKYSGWKNFSTTVMDCIDAFIESFPNADRFLKLKSIQFRYINAFTEAHGFISNSQFASEFLQLTTVFNTEFINKLGINIADVNTASTSHFPLSEPKQSYATVKAGDAVANNKKIFFLQVEIGKKNNLLKEDLGTWLQSAHSIARLVFNSLVSDSLRLKMDPEER